MSSKFELKLVIEEKSQKLVFAEVGKDVVDFLLSWFALPMGSMINIITKDSSIGSLGIMYSSWDQLHDNILSSFKMKASHLIPAIASASSTAELRNFAPILSSASPATITEQVYTCNYCPSAFMDVYETTCKRCGRTGRISRCDYIGSTVTHEEVKRNGYVKGSLTYAVMDDLLIVPLTASLSSISLLKKLGHNNLSQLEEETVSLDVQTEGLELLKTSLWSKNVLTEVFLAKKKDGLQKEDK